MEIYQTGTRDDNGLKPENKRRKTKGIEEERVDIEMNDISQRT